MSSALAPLVKATSPTSESSSTSTNTTPNSNHPHEKPNYPPPLMPNQLNDNFDVDRELLGKIALPEPNDFVGALAEDDLGLSLGGDFADKRSVFDGCILVEDSCVLVRFFWDDLDVVLDVDINRNLFSMIIHFFVQRAFHM